MKDPVYRTVCLMGLMAAIFCACATQNYHPIAEPQLNQMGINFIRSNRAVEQITGLISDVALVSGETTMERNFLRARKDTHIERRIYKVTGAKTEINVAVELEDTQDGWAVTRLVAVDPGATDQMAVEIPINR